MGRLRSLRRTTHLRIGLVAVLLLTATALLYRDLRPDEGTAGLPTPGVAPPTALATPAATTPTRTTPSVWPDDPAGWPAAPPPELDPDLPPPGGQPARLPIPAGTVGVTVPLAEPAMLAILRPGDLVDLLSVPAEGGEPVLIAASATVLAVAPAAAAVLLALTDDQARTVHTTTDGRLAVTLRP